MKARIASVPPFSRIVSRKLAKSIADTRPPSAMKARLQLHAHGGVKGYTEHRCCCWYLFEEGHSEGSSLVGTSENQLGFYLIIIFIRRYSISSFRFKSHKLDYVLAD